MPSWGKKGGIGVGERVAAGVGAEGATVGGFVDGGRKKESKEWRVGDG
jgi:hypothetical protein